MSEETFATIETPVTGDGVKPKRQLTEAQRLAFLKARETRARNVALRREQKLAEETDKPPAEKKPRAKRTPKGSDGGEPERKRVTVTVDEPTVIDNAIPTDSAETKVQEEETTIDHTAESIPLATAAGELLSSLPEMPDPHHYAKLVADIIYEKLNTEMAEEEPVPEKPKIKRARNTRRPRLSMAPRGEEQPIDASEQPQPATTNPTATTAPRAVAWM